MAPHKSSSTATQVFAVSRKAVDPTLDSLFASSFGFVKAPPKSRYEAAPPPRPSKQADDDEEDVDIENDEELSEISGEELPSGDEEMEDAETASGAEFDSVPENKKAKPELQPRKRRRGDDTDNLEDRYLAKLAEDEERQKKSSKAERKSKRQKVAPLGSDSDQEENDSDDDSDGSGEVVDEVDNNDAESVSEEDNDRPLDVPQHESLAKSAEALELEKSARTVFLSNVSTLAISDKKAKKTLLNHMSSFFKETDTSATGKEQPKVESLRFRSTAFAGGSLPKKAAFIKQELMDATTKSTNAYVVYSTPTTAREAVKKLNGTVVLGRHLRVDGVAHPSKIDHRRCVFVGNLGFVDDETIMEQDGEKSRKRNKVPSDVEEGLWRTFSKAGEVESVRVPRDPKTRVGKGFAYVQFKDANAVEAALLLNEKKFPPMLPRALRVTRAKSVKKTASHNNRDSRPSRPEGKRGSNGVYNPKVSSQEQSLHGRAAKLFGKAGAAKMKSSGKPGPRREQKPKVLEGIARTPESIIFEGVRASEKAGRPRDLKFKTKSKNKNPAGNRSSKRAAEWKKSGGRKAKD